MFRLGKPDLLLSPCWTDFGAEERPGPPPPAFPQDDVGGPAAAAAALALTCLLR